MTATMKFGLEFELNRSTEDPEVCKIVRELRMDVCEDGSVTTVDGGYGDVEHDCDCEYYTTDDGDYLYRQTWRGGTAYYEMALRNECSCCRGECECMGSGCGAEIKSDGPTEWAEVVRQYTEIRNKFGQQNSECGIHTHISAECECGYEGTPALVPLDNWSKDDLLDKMAALVGEHRVNTFYVGGSDWDGVLRPRGGYMPLCSRREYKTIEARWMHSSLTPEGYVEALKLTIRHMICGRCCRPLGNDEVFSTPDERSAFAEASHRWAQGFGKVIAERPELLDVTVLDDEAVTVNELKKDLVKAW